MLEHLREEGKALERWRETGILLEAYSPGRPGAVLILELPGPEDAHAHIGQLPLSVAGLIETELFELHPLQY